MKIIKDVIFIGTSDFAVPTLEKLISYTKVSCETKRINLNLVVTQPDQRKGRNLKLQYSPVKEIALKHGISIFQPTDINSSESIQKIRSYNSDLCVVISYGAFLSKPLRTMFPFGTVNLHPSLLPKHRGADPVRSAILANDSLFGISYFFINSKMDSGPIILQKSYCITNLHEIKNYTNISKFLSEKGADLLYETIQVLQNKYNDLPVDKALKDSFPKQDNSLATYSHKVTKYCYKADFSLTVNDFLKRVEAYSHEPGYYCFFRNKRIKILKTSLYKYSENESYPIIKELIQNIGFTISLKNGDILVHVVQQEGKNKICAWQFSLGARLSIGEKFE
jgi:methionyl-tRNA formyltransferase